MPPPKEQHNRHGDGVFIKRRGESYLYRVYDGFGNRRAKSFRRTQEDAKRTAKGTAEGDRWAAQKRAQAALRGPTLARLSLKDAGDAYALIVEASGASDSYVGIVKNITSRAVAAGIDDLRAEDVAMRTMSWLSRLRACRPGQVKDAPASPRLKNKALTVLRSIAQQQVKEGRLDLNPFLAVRRAKELARDPRLFTITELRTMVGDAHCDHHGWLLAVLAAYTGQRSETLRSVTWRMLDWERNRISIPADILKQDSPVRVPLQSELAAILKPIAKRNASTIVPVGTVRDSDHANEVFTSYLKRCDIPRMDRGLHVLRASHASLLIASGTPPTIVQVAVGWTQAQTMHRYVKGAEEYRDQVRAEGWEPDELFLRRSPPRQSMSVRTVVATGICKSKLTKTFVRTQRSAP